MLLSQTSRYALRAATLLAERDESDPPMTAAELAEVLGLPRNYLSKTLHQLARRGILTSERGPSGGFRLAAPPGKIRLAQVIDPVDPSLRERECLLGREICSDAAPCAAHHRWREVADVVERFLGETTLEDLIRGR